MPGEPGRGGLPVTLCLDGHIVIGYSAGHLSGCPVYTSPLERCCAALRAIEDYPAVEAAHAIGGPAAARLVWKDLKP